ncbi:MAG: MOSC domain-containing protein [Acidimicrobiales bacterium]
MEDVAGSKLEGRILSVNVGMPRDLGREGAEQAFDRPWRTGMLKDPVAGPVWVGRTNLAGDGQGDTRIHGGPDRAVHAYPSEHYASWRRQLPGLELDYAAFGENLTTLGLTEATVCIGDSFEAGRAVVQVTQPRIPCWKLGRRFRVKDMAVRFRTAGRVGWHMRVLVCGNVQAGEPITLLERPEPSWTLERSLQVILDPLAEPEAALQLAGSPYLSAYQRRALLGPGTVARRVEIEE